MCIYIFGSDGRFLYTQKFLMRNGLLSENVSDLNSLARNDGEKLYIVLPLPFSRNGITLNVRKKINVLDLIEILQPGDTVFGGKLSEEFISRLKSKGVTVHDYYCEEFCEENAFLTATGLMKYVKEEKIELHKKNIALLGFGRCGTKICSCLKEGRNKFTVFSRSDEACKKAHALQYSFKYLDKLKDNINSFDIIINTVPDNVLTKEMLKHIKKDAAIVDIASYPYALNKDDLVESRCKYFLASSLPGKFESRKAGELIGGFVKREVKP